ncbi:MAG: helix-turn-helix domain-containing protein [Treponema sp.]|nr:helix-turn-helix domain-containing protein [Treponema sp.]
MEEMKDRIIRLRKELKLTQKEFAEKIGLGHSALSRIETGENSLKKDRILLICTPNRLETDHTVNEDWLRNGGDDNAMFKATPQNNERPRLFENNKELPVDEEELIGIYRQLTPPNKIVADKQITALLEGQPGAKPGERRANTAKDFG